MKVPFRLSALPFFLSFFPFLSFSSRERNFSDDDDDDDDMMMVTI